MIRFATSSEGDSSAWTILNALLAVAISRSVKPLLSSAALILGDVDGSR